MSTSFHFDGDIASFSSDGTRRTVYGYRAGRYEIPRGCVAGHMPELNAYPLGDIR